MKSIRSAILIAGLCSLFVMTASAFQVTTTTPAPAASGVTNNTAIAVGFDANPDTNTVSASTFEVWGEQSGVVTGGFVFGVNAITFSPSKDFLPGETVIVMLNTGVLDQSSTPLNSYTFEFEIGAKGPGCDPMTFARSTPIGGDNTYQNYESAIADFNGSGFPDILAIHVNRPDSLWTNDGTGRFGKLWERNGTVTRGIATGDFDGDGDLDYAAGIGSWSPNKIYFNNGDGTFSQSIQTLGTNFTRDLAAGDLNGDGSLDLFEVSYFDSEEVWTNDGSGYFYSTGQDFGAHNPHNVDLGDVDGDGDIDAVVSGEGSSLRVYINDGSATFTTSTVLSVYSSWDLEFVDIDDDGDLDILNASAATTTRGVLIATNDGTGQFSIEQLLPAVYGSRAVGSADFDGDGDQDILVGGSGFGELAHQLWFNEGDRKYRRAQYAFGGGILYGVEIADLDLDGDLDMFFANVNRMDEIWLNSCAQVTNTMPATAATLVDRYAPLEVQVDDELNVSTVSANGVQLWGSYYGPYDVAVTATGETINVASSMPFVPGEQMRLMVRQAQDTNGHAVTPHTLEFVAANPASTPLNFKPYQVLDDGGRIRLADMNRDGMLDLVTTESGAIYLNAGQGTFSNAFAISAPNIKDIALAELDGDDYIDAYTANGSGPGHFVFHNVGTGELLLTQLVSSAGSAGVVIGDLGNDGFNDIVVLYDGGFSNAVYHRGDVLSWPAVQHLPFDEDHTPALGDVDGDGFLDLVVPTGGSNVVLRNDGYGYFEEWTTLGMSDSRAVALGDLDGDMDLDAVFANVGSASVTYLNNGDGTFTTNQLLGEGVDVVLADLDASGRLDAVIAGAGLYYNDGSGTLTADQQLGLDADHVDAGDLDGDGDIDIAFGTSTGTVIWINGPDTSGQAPVFLAGGTPIILPAPAEQNNYDEAMDLDLVGGPLSTIDNNGFNSLGHVYFNHDASNLYLGAYGVDVAERSPKNAYVAIFLGVGSLTNDVTDMSEVPPLVNPGGLGSIVNLSFDRPMDVGILVGDEYGDFTVPTWSMEGGQSVGQGAYIIDATGITAVAGVRLQQFDASYTNQTTFVDNDGNRYTDAWEMSIPWSELGATGPDDLGSLYACGVIADNVSAGRRFISGSFLGRDARSYNYRESNTDYGYSNVTIYAAEVHLPGGDYDGDSLPDGIELATGLSPTNALDAFSDYDEDQQVALHEYIAGTSWTNGNDFLVVGYTEMPNPGDVKMYFTAAAGRTYHVEGTTDFITWSPVFSFNPAPGPGSISFSTGPEPARSYRLRVEWP